MLPSRLVAAILPVGLMVAGAGVVCGQDYPSKPIRIVVGAAGGGADVVARQIAQALSGPLGQPVIVDNRTALQASEAGAKAPPDGYTLHVAGGATWIAPLLQKVPYDVVRDFSPIAIIVREVLMVTVHPSLPVKSVKELIALAKARPGEINYAAGVVGSTPQLAAELFKHMPGYEMVSMTGLFAPAKTPGAIVNRRNQEVARALNRADVKERFFNAGTETVGGTPEQFAAAVKSDIERLGKVIRDAGLKAD